LPREDLLHLGFTLEESIIAHSRSFRPARILPHYYHRMYLNIGKRSRSNTLSQR